MMARNPNWWSMNINGGMHPPDYQLQFPPNSSNLSLISDRHHHPGQDFPVRSWSQFLLGGGEDERYGGNLFQQQKKLENWEDQVLLNLNPCNNFAVRVSAAAADHVKQEIVPRQPGYGDDEFPAVRSSASASSNCWPAAMPAIISSPASCVTNSILNFSSGNNKSVAKSHHHDHSSECNSSSTTTGGVTKKARVQQSSAQPALKVRKEKLGDRITALHQLVSPFGKTDTASVLSEAIGYIRFLQGQIEALSSPYMRNASTGHQHQQHSFLNDIGMERIDPKQDSSEEQSSDLRSRGLCLVPISCTQHMANDTTAGGADYWAPAALGGGF